MNTSTDKLKQDPAWVRVAAANSSDDAKAAADFVCSGEHDEATIQKAIDRCAADGRGLFLHNGLYHIDAFREWNDGGPRAAVRIPLVRRTFAIAGMEAFQNGNGAIPEDLSNWRNGVIWYVREEAWGTAGDGVPSVLHQQERVSRLPYRHEPALGLVASEPRQRLR